MVNRIISHIHISITSTINKDETLEEIKEWDDVLARIEIQERFGWYFFRRSANYKLQEVSRSRIL